MKHKKKLTRYRVYISQVNQTYVDVKAAGVEQAKDMAARKWRREEVYAPIEAAKALQNQFSIETYAYSSASDEELADLLAPFLRRAAESKWHDIATAPKDGENVLLWDGVRTSLAWFSAASDEWLDGTDFVLPTHWMPLPDAPR